MPLPAAIPCRNTLLRVPTETWDVIETICFESGLTKQSVLIALIQDGIENLLGQCEPTLPNKFERQRVSLRMLYGKATK